MDQTNKRNALIARVAERIFVANAGTWPVSQPTDLAEKAFTMAVAYANFMIDLKDAFKDIPTENADLIDILDDIDTRLMGLDEKTGVHIRGLTEKIEHLIEVLAIGFEKQRNVQLVATMPVEPQVR